MHNGNLLVNEKNKGLLKIVNGSLQLLPGTGLFKNNKIYFLAPYDKNKARELIIGTRSIGFFIYDGKAVKPFSTGADDYLKINKLAHGIRLSSGDFALATLHGSLVVIDPQGHLKDILDKTSSLQDDDVKYVFHDIHENLWLCLNNGISKIEYASPFSIYDQRCKLEGLVTAVLKHDNVLYAGTRIPPTVQVNAIYPDPDGKTTWFASNDGLFSFDTTAKKDYTQRFHTLIRKVLVNEKQKNEKKLLDGPVNKNKTDKAAKGFFPIIEYRDRNLYFEFAAPFFEAETRTQYRCFLEGYDSDWSTWNKDTRKYYTNLDSGLYNFRVQAKNIYDYEGKEDAFRFKILPPWYNTWWSFIIYAFLLLGLMFLVVKWRSGRLEQEKQRLEQLVKERTKEVYHKNELLEEQSQKLKEMDRMKSRFFANISHEFRTPLTLILSPLEKMLSNSQDRQQKKELNVMRRNSQRLLTLINQLLDLTRFDSGKMTLQAAYQNICERYGNRHIPGTNHPHFRSLLPGSEFQREEPNRHGNRACINQRDRLIASRHHRCPQPQRKRNRI